MDSSNPAPIPISLEQLVLRIALSFQGGCTLLVTAVWITLTADVYFDLSLSHFMFVPFWSIPSSHNQEVPEPYLTLILAVQPLRRSKEKILFALTNVLQPRFICRYMCRHHGLHNLATMEHSQRKLNLDEYS